MTPLATAAVALRGVSRTYGTGPAAVRAVDRVDLDFPRGTWTAVMGPSGSGKSTLLHWTIRPLPPTRTVSCSCVTGASSTGSPGRAPAPLPTASCPWSADPMLRLSWSTFTERWSLFAGAALTVCLGVALVQSSMLVLISVATLDVPAGLSATELAVFAESVEVGVTLSALTLAFSAFLTVFIVGSTFAFTVAQRRRDLALLRLAGGGRSQLRRLLLGEAVLLGGIGTAAGVPVGLATMSFQSWLLGALGFVPPGFTPQWRMWILGVSAGVGVGIAVAGVLVAARRASRVRPLEALRDTGEAARVMTASRWGVGGLFGAGVVAVVVLSPLGGAGGG